ncbi:MAG: hypothetical protein M0R03_17380 [Novosphingobium sp.]|nr:hypothetical protein [Novosphingobium sp.]
MKKSEQVRDFVKKWNSIHPLDLWWRKKHNVAFMSKRHKSISFLDQIFEYYEDQYYNEVIEEELRNRGLIDEEDDRPEDEKILEMNNEFEKYLKEKGIDG